MNEKINHFLTIFMTTSMGYVFELCICHVLIHLYRIQNVVDYTRLHGGFELLTIDVRFK
jgi:hypothetical protein